MSVRSYQVEYHSREEFGEDLDFDTVDVNVDESLIIRSTAFVNSSPDLESVTINIDLDKVTFFKENVVVTIPCVVFFNVVVNKLFTYCSIILDDNVDIMVECSEVTE